MIAKVHNIDGRKIVAICDSGLIGKKFEENNLRLDLTSGFYKGEEKSERDIINLIKGAYIVNIVGDKSINLAEKAGIVDPKCVIRIRKIPHAQAIVG